MLTFKQWQDKRVKELCAKYPRFTSETAREACTSQQWHDKHILPAMERGETPPYSVAKSLVEHSPYSPLQLEKIWRGQFGRETMFWPSGFDYDGMKVVK